MRLLPAAVVVAIAATGCFQVGPEPVPTPVPKGSISGRIITGGASGQSARSVDTIAAENAARAELAAAWSSPSIAAPIVDDLDVAGAAAPPRHEFVAGEAVVLFERTTFDADSLRHALAKMRSAAHVDDVEITLSRCVAKFMCKVTLTDDKGYLDEQRTLEVVGALHKHRVDNIKNVGTNDISHGFRIPDDPGFAQQWHLPQVKLPAAWDLTVGDPDLVVAVVDSGVVHANPDLRARLARDPANPNTFVEMDFVDVSASLDGDGPDLSAEDPGDNAFGDGQHSFHGTHVSGIVGAQTNNGLGVSGVLWEAKILPVRVLGDGLSGSLFDIVTGLLWAVGEDDTGTGLPGNLLPAKVVNLSLGGITSTSAQQTWEDAIEIIFADPEGKYTDPIIVVAAGNSAINADQVVPANIPRLITVGASRVDGLRANYSNFGGSIDIMAPGGQEDLDLNNDNVADGILSTWSVDLKLEQGTSMAAPIVSGLAGLLLASKPELTHDQIHELVTQTADVRFRCTEGCGNGQIDAVQAMIAAGVEAEPTPRLTLDTQRVIFAGGTTTLSIRALNLGSADAPFTISLERSQASLFTVTPTSGTVPPATASTPGVDLTITLNRGDVQVGTAVLVLTGTGAAAGQKAEATLSFDTNPSRGRQGVAEVEVGVFERVNGSLTRVGSAIALEANNFAWTIDGLEEGAYEVYAVGDDNRDGTFDRTRESFGAYPLTDGIQQVIIDDEDTPVTGIDFSIALKVIELSTRGVGAPCTSDDAATSECSDVLSFAPSVGCITTFDGGYCSRFCDEDNICGADGRCEIVGCGADGQTDCRVCLKGCVADSQCRDNYLCVLGTCVPEGFYDTN